MVILGIDPALATLGWGVIGEEGSRLKYMNSGIIKTQASQLMTKRLATITLKLQEIINLYKPDIIAMEETFINSNAVSSLKLGFVRGAIMAMVGRYNLDFIELKPNVIKKTVVGVGHAEKSQVMHMIKILLSGSAEVNSLDESDALAIAYTGIIYSKDYKIKH